MTKKIGGWRRFSIVASALWLAVGIWFFYAKANETGVAAASSVYAMCVAGAKTNDCSAELTRNVQLFTSGSWMEAAVNAITPLLAAWLLIYLAVRVRRATSIKQTSVTGAVEH